MICHKIIKKTKNNPAAFLQSIGFKMRCRLNDEAASDREEPPIYALYSKRCSSKY